MIHRIGVDDQDHVIESEIEADHLGVKDIKSVLKAFLGHKEMLTLNRALRIHQ